MSDMLLIETELLTPGILLPPQHHMSLRFAAEIKNADDAADIVSAVIEAKMVSDAEEQRLMDLSFIGATDFVNKWTELSGLYYETEQAVAKLGRMDLDTPEPVEDFDLGLDGMSFQDMCQAGVFKHEYRDRLIDAVEDGDIELTPTVEEAMDSETLAWSIIGLVIEGLLTMAQLERELEGSRDYFKTVDELIELRGIPAEMAVLVIGSAQ